MRDSLRRIVATLVAITKDNLSNRITLFFIIFFPIILTLVFALVGYSFINSTIPTVYVINSAEREGNKLINYINASGLVNLIEVNNISQIPIGQTYVIIPNGYPKDRVEIYYSNDIIGEKVFMLLKYIINSYNSNNIVNGETISTSLNPISSLIIGVIGIAVSANALFGITGVTIGYERDKVLLRLASSPLRNIEYLIAIVLYQLILATISVLVILFSSYIMGLKMTISPIFIIPFLEGLFFFGGLGGIIVGLTPRGKIFLANVVSNALFFPLMFFSNAVIPSSALPYPFSIIINFNPISIINDAFRYLILYNNINDGLLYSFEILPFSIIFIALGAKLVKLREV
jgi:ABC-2 type transport system permease protein